MHAHSCPTLCDPVDYSLSGSSGPWDSPGKNTGVGCHFLLQEIFPTQGLNPGFPHCRQTLYGLSHQGSISVLLKNMFFCPHTLVRGFPGGSDGKESACSVGDPGSIPGSRRSPGEGNGSPPVFLPGAFHGHRILAGYMGSHRIGHD